MIQVYKVQVGVSLAQSAMNVRSPSLSQPFPLSLRYCLWKRHAALSYSLGWINTAPVLTRAQGSETRVEGGARVCFHPLSPDRGNSALLMFFAGWFLRVLVALVVLTKGLAT